MTDAATAAETVASIICRHGTEEGADCRRFGCDGLIRFERPQNCSCHLGMAPCGSCENVMLECPICGWREDE